MKIEYYLNNSALLINRDFIADMLRGMGWFLIQGLCLLADAMKHIYDTAFGFIDFTTWSVYNQYIDYFKPVFLAVMSLSLFALGIMLVMGKEKKPKIAINIVIALLLLSSSTVIFSAINGLVKDFKEGVDNFSITGSSQQQDPTPYSIVGQYTWDVYSIDQNNGLGNVNFNNNKKSIKNGKINIDKNTIGLVKINEFLDPDDRTFKWSAEAKEILENKIVPVGYDYTSRVSYVEEENYNGLAWTSFGNEFYYRYKVEFMPIIIILFSTVLLYFAMSYKVVRIGFELVVGRLLAYIYSAELSNGERIGKILIFIRDSYITLLMTAVCIKIFFLANIYISETVENIWIKCFLVLFVAFSVIDGPNLVEKLLGMDVGLQSSVARIFAMGHFAKAGGKGVGEIAKGFKKLFSVLLGGKKGKDSDGASNSFERNTTNNGKDIGSEKMGGEAKVKEKKQGSDFNRDTGFMDSKNKDSRNDFMGDKNSNDNQKFNSDDTSFMNKMNGANFEDGKPEDKDAVFDKNNELNKKTPFNEREDNTNRFTQKEEQGNNSQNKVFDEKSNEEDNRFSRTNDVIDAKNRTSTHLADDTDVENDSSESISNTGKKTNRSSLNTNDSLSENASSVNSTENRKRSKNIDKSMNKNNKFKTTKSDFKKGDRDMEKDSLINRFTDFRDNNKED